jgi:hypothetical protein
MTRLARYLNTKFGRRPVRSRHDLNARLSDPSAAPTTLSAVARSVYVDALEI